MPAYSDRNRSVAPASILDSDNLLDRAIEAHYADIKAAVLRRGCARGLVSDVVHDLYDRRTVEL